jgi:hypothetical protein
MPGATGALGQLSGDPYTRAALVVARDFGDACIWGRSAYRRLDAPGGACDAGLDLRGRRADCPQPAQLRLPWRPADTMRGQANQLRRSIMPA